MNSPLLPPPPRDSPKTLAKRRSSVKALGSEGSAAALGLQLPDVLGIQQQLWSTMLPRAMYSPSRMQPPSTEVSQVGMPGPSRMQPLPNAETSSQQPAPNAETSSQQWPPQPQSPSDGPSWTAGNGFAGGSEAEDGDAVEVAGAAESQQQEACGREEGAGGQQLGALSPSERGAGAGGMFPRHLDERGGPPSGGGEAAVGGHIDTMHLLTAMTNANLQGSRGRLVVVVAAGDGGGDSKRQTPSSLLQKLAPQRPFVGQCPLPPLALAAVNKTSSLYGPNNGKKSVTVMQIDFSGVGPAKQLEG